MASQLSASIMHAFRIRRLPVWALVFTLAPQVFAQTGPSEKAAEATPPATPSAEQCVVAHRESQTLRRQYHLLESRDRLLECSNTACPGMVRKECQRWLDEVAVQISSVVVHVETGGSSPPDNIKVYIDGTLRFESIPNRAIELDPGTYRFRFEVPDRQPVELQVTVVEAEKFKNVTVKYSPPGKETDGLSVGRDDATHKPVSIRLVAPQKAERPVPTATYIFAGLGAAAAVNFAVWGIWTQSLKSTLEDKCAPDCHQEYITRIKTRALIADISLGVSVAALSTAAITYFARSEVKPPVDVALGPLPNGGFFGQLKFAAF